MADIFTKTNINDLLKNKTVWFFGDSNVRAVYKDFVWLFQTNSLIPLGNLKAKLEKNFKNDKLLKGTTAHKARNYEEIRQYENYQLKTKFEFMFLTKCLTQDVEDLLDSLMNGVQSPDIIIMNSCVWDIARWGPDGIDNYKLNITTLMKLFKRSLSPHTLVIWMTTPPLATEPYGGFFIKQIEFMKHTFRFEVMEANMFVQQEVVSHGFDVVDVHHHLLLQIHRRRPDGIHWNAEAVRHMTNLLLTHISLALNHRLPGNFKSSILDKMINLVSQPIVENPANRETMKHLNMILDTLQSPKRPPKTKKKKNRGNYIPTVHSRVNYNHENRPRNNFKNSNNYGGRKNWNHQHNYRPY